MTDLSALTAEELAEKVLAAIVEAAMVADENGCAVLYSQLHRADGYVIELVRRASERDQAERERDRETAVRLEIYERTLKAEQRADRLAAVLERIAEFAEGAGIEKRWVDGIAKLARDALEESEETPG